MKTRELTSQAVASRYLL